MSEKKITWELFPYKQCKDNFKVELPEGIEKSVMENQIKEINSVIADSQKLKEK